jgi:uncharacterized iron-regulated membrane protein
MPTEPQQVNLYLIIWRWHFYAGLFVAPVLIVAAISGALLIFREDLERLLYPHTLFVTPSSERVSYDRQLAAAQAFMPEATAVGCGIDANPFRATAVYLRIESGGRVVYVDPYQGQVLGDETELKFFRNVLALHRKLFLGGFGSVIVELMTCWTIVLLLSGAYLWWPRKGRHVWGVWLPRLRSHPQAVVRDLHAVCGPYVWCVALAITCTGLVYSTLWGSAYSLAARISDGSNSWWRPTSHSPAQGSTLTIDEIVAIARQNLPGASLTITLPSDREAAIVVRGNWNTCPTSQRVLCLDRATGEVLQDRSNRDLGILEWWRTLNYPLHVGSVLGTPTKVIWLFACLALIVLPVTGVWMWWQRRPPGQTGLPLKPMQPVPRWLLGIIITLSILLPMFGLSVAAIILGERAVRRAMAARAARDGARSD